MFISIIIPIYNENDILEKNIFDIHKYFQNKNNFEIIVIDDGSADDTLKTLRALKLNNLIILKNNQNIGKGYSIIKGVLKSKGDLILQTDADLSAPITEFEKLFKKYKKGYDFVIGSRSTSNSKVKTKQNFLRIILGKFFNILTYFILNLNYNDTQCGFKIYNSMKLKNIIKLCKVKKFCIDVEILYLAKIKKYKVIEEGIIWNDKKNSKVNLIKDPLNMFVDLVKIKFHKYKLN